MSKVFKRPMFRRGGDVNEGIMSGMRSNFANGMSAKERLAAAVAKYPSQALDPLTQFLIQGGLKLVSQPTTGGGVIADIATAVQEPTKELMTGLAERGKTERELALAGEQLDIEAEQAEKLAKIKNQMKDYFAAETPQAQFEVLFKEYTDESQIAPIRNNAKNLADFEVRMNQLNKDYSQLGFTPNKKGNYIPNWGSIPKGAITYNPMTGLAYIRDKVEKGDASDFTPLNPRTLQPYLDTKG